MSSPRPTAEEFLRSQLWRATLAGAFQRNTLYRSDASSEQRRRFREALRVEVEKLEKLYAKPITDARHTNNIVSLADSMSAAHGNALEGKRFRVGGAQKVLNLWLKCLWCAGLLERPPPHCPFDRLIIQMLDPRLRHHAWTSLDDIADYKALVKCAKALASSRGLSLPQWELKEYERSNAQRRSGNY